MAPSILVGVDGSEENTVALDWAVDEALLRGWELHLLYSAWLPMMEPVFVGREQILRDSAQQLLAESVQRARRRAPDLPMRSTLVYDSPGAALVRASAHADLVVVGLRGRGGFPGMKIGSVAYQVAAHASAPVVVVGTESPVATDPAEIVVGIDDSPHGRAALRAALTEARLRDARVRAIYAVRYPRDPVAEVMIERGYDRESLRAENQRQAELLLKEAREDHPDVRVLIDVQWDDATHALGRASVTARLVVVGARGRRGFPRLALGSVAHGVLHHASSPVMIVHVPGTVPSGE